jgi:FixJ family two-component response regulator
MTSGTGSSKERSRRVFVVDDDEAVLDSLELLLKSAGFEVQCFRSAADLLAREDIDDAGCLVLDVRLQGMTGLELARRLKEDGHRVPAILITGHLEAVTMLQAETDGILDVLHKPFDANALLAWIERSLAPDRADPEAVG